MVLMKATNAGAVSQAVERNLGSSQTHIMPLLIRTEIHAVAE